MSFTHKHEQWLPHCDSRNVPTLVTWRCGQNLFNFDAKCQNTSKNISVFNCIFPRAILLCLVKAVDVLYYVENVLFVLLHRRRCNVRQFMRVSEQRLDEAWHVFIVTVTTKMNIELPNVDKSLLAGLCQKFC